MIDLEEAIEEMCQAVDKFSNVPCTPGTPIHTFQQDMIRHVKTYRSYKDKGRCEISGIEWDGKEVTGVNP